MKLIWTRESLEKLSEIETFIAQDSPEIAERFVNYLIDKCESLLNTPQIGRIVPEILNPNIRELIVKEYRIVYKTQENSLQILTVFEGHRLLRIDELDID